MKAIKFILFVIIIGFISACKTDLKITGDKEEIPIVYSLLNASDTAHFVRLQRAFLSDNPNEDMLSSDSNYFDSDLVTITIDEILNNIVLNSYSFSKMDLAKEQGLFGTSGHHVYALENTTLNKDATYKLKINVDGNEKDAAATTSLVDDISILKPLGLELSFTANSALLVEWRNAQNAALYQLTLRINYLENGSEESLDWTFAEKESSVTNGTGSTIQKILNRDAFYQFLEEKLDPMSVGSRVFQGIDLIVSSADENFKIYKELIANQQLSSDVPEFTNIENGKGLFASRNVYFETRTINANSLDSLKNGRYTKDLGF